MNYLSDYSDKTVSEIVQSRTHSSFTKVTFTDGDELTVSVDSREFYDRSGNRVDVSDFDAAHIDSFFGGTIREPVPPRWRKPKDRPLRTITDEFTTLQVTLMRLCGERHAASASTPSYEQRWREATDRWRYAVQRLHGYNRYKSETHERVPEEPKKTLLQRLMWWRQPSDPYERDRK